MKIELTKQEASAILAAIASSLRENSIDNARTFVFFENKINEQLIKEKS